MIPTVRLPRYARLIPDMRDGGPVRYLLRYWPYVLIVVGLVGSIVNLALQ